MPAGVFQYDDNDEDIVIREIDIPAVLVNDGNNTVVADFVSNGGALLSAVLEVTRSIGDFNGSGAFDGEDLSLLQAQFGSVPLGSKYDLVGDDGVVDMDDVNFWLSELRGITVGFGDFDLDNDVDDDDLAIWTSNYKTGTHYGQGDFDLDGDVDGMDFLRLQTAYTEYAAMVAAATAVPEPSSAVLLLVASLGGLVFRRPCRS